MLVPANVKRAEQLKRETDKAELDLKLAVRELSATTSPVIRESTGQWAIYWRDRNFKFHECKRKCPTKNEQARCWTTSTAGGDQIFWE